MQPKIIYEEHKWFFYLSSLLFICHVSFTNDPSLENITFRSHLRKWSYFFLKACKCPSCSGWFWLHGFWSTALLIIVKYVPGSVPQSPKDSDEGAHPCWVGPRCPVFGLQQDWKKGIFAQHFPDANDCSSLMEINRAAGVMGRPWEYRWLWRKRWDRSQSKWEENMCTERDTVSKSHTGCFSRHTPQQTSSNGTNSSRRSRRWC